jgi:hypothetical protein
VTQHFVNRAEVIARLKAMAGRVNMGEYDARFLRSVADLLVPDAKLVIVESPYKGLLPGDIERNEAYARRAMHDSLRRGESPFLSHLLYTQVLLDEVHADRRLGIEAGLRWGRPAGLTAVYADYGITDGMHEGIDRAKGEGRRVVKRMIGENP